MKNLLKSSILILLLLTINLGIAQVNPGESNPISTDSYNLYKPNNTEAVLILFGGFPENGEIIETEFPITDMALEEEVAVIYMNYNRKLWLEESQKAALANDLKVLFETNNLPKKKIFIGGLSSGGNIAILIGNYLAENSNLNLEPTGVFVVDSPIDLAALYKITEENIKKDFSEASVGESTFIHNYFKSQLGNPNEEIKPYEDYSVFTHETKNYQNIEDLKNTKLRFYSEPDKEWWKKNMGVDYDQMNAFHLKRLTKFLQEQDYKDVEYITSENKGYRSNGERHPHSWSIVNKEDLLRWILEE
ncbi:hypothetical protein [Christiangramia echinicola]|uniref:Alpha/beta hydrolase fold n=1 Tax=Christiangramia echinicola TaxID=279359 RepID=A0A1H1LB82_9FLAO|nr:hypothetical protein [Christiangramia echinicola]SDR71687.1 hypothetical protein SAMN04488552_0676 [Christiangramia echinicola]